jgi:hypothetical protein
MDDSQRGSIEALSSDARAIWNASNKPSMSMVDSQRGSNKALSSDARAIYNAADRPSASVDDREMCAIEVLSLLRGETCVGPSMSRDDRRMRSTQGIDLEGNQCGKTSVSANDGMMVFTTASSNGGTKQEVDSQNKEVLVDALLVRELLSSIKHYFGVPKR